MRYGSIYKITCLINNKIYIGQTVQNPPIKRWLDHYEEINRPNNQLLLRIFGVSREMISDINTGETWYFKNECYPIRDNSDFKNKLTEDDVYDIYDLLRSNVSLSEIAKEYKVSITNIGNINRGKIYKFLDEDNYPLYKPVNSKTRLGLEKAEKIIKILISNPEYTYSKIGDIVGVGRKTVSGINNGKLYVDLASKLGVYKYPIR